MLEELKEALAPHVFEAIMSIITLLVGYVSVLLRRWTGIQLEEKHRAALHSAIRTGVLTVMERNLSHKDVIASVKDYVAASVPDAVRYLMPGESVLETLILSKIKELGTK